MTEQHPKKKLREIFLIIAWDQFHFLKFILEGYDSLCTLSSYDSTRGIVKIYCPVEMVRDLFELLDSLATKLNPVKPRNNISYRDSR